MKETHPMGKAMYISNMLHCFTCIVFKVFSNRCIFLASLALVVFATITLLTCKNLEQIKKNCSAYIERHTTL